VKLGQDVSRIAGVVRDRSPMATMLAAPKRPRRPETAPRSTGAEGKSPTIPPARGVSGSARYER